MALTADARPTKRFFLEMITRDISMEDAILDLIDNSIDSFIRTREIHLTPERLLSGSTFVKDANGRTILGSVDVTMTDQEFSITDTTGGIPRKRAVSDIFRFGSDVERNAPSLGVYGIGMKRAIFKLGNEIQITSRTRSEGFSVRINANAWLKKKDDWNLPIKFIPGTDHKEEPGTTITIRQLHSEVVMRIKDGSAERRLKKIIASTYPFFLGRMVRVTLNGFEVPPDPIPLGESEALSPSRDAFEVNGVAISLLASVADRSKGEWNIERAGWYILCNGRVVVSADKTELTGWGVTSPQFVSKYRGFIGFAFFFAEDPIKLPWTTTKRGINHESVVFLSARNRMQLAARPVLSFLNSFYPSDPEPDPSRRALAEDVRAADISKLTADKQSVAFTVRAPVPVVKTTVRVQYDAQVEDLDRIRKCLRRSSMSAGKIGEHTLKYFLDMECPK